MNSLLLAILLTAATPSFEVQTLEGQTLVGPLAELSADRLAIDAADGRISFETEKLLSISAKDKSAPVVSGVVVELIDGSLIGARNYAAQGSQAKITLADGNVLEAPTNTIRSVQFQQESGSLVAEWARLAKMEVDGDLLVVRKDATIDYHQGVVRDVTDDAVRFDLDGETLPVKRSKVYGLVYRHGANSDMPAAICRITDSTGSQWSVHSLALSNELQWTTPAGLSVAQPVDAILQIDFSVGKIVYLSDLKPDSVHWTPYFASAKSLTALEKYYAPRYDRNFDGKPLELGGTQYRKGLTLHSRSELVYRLPDRFSRFRAVVGIDDAARPAGKVRLIVRGDDKELLDVVVLGADAPRPLDLDLTGVRRLMIVVDFGDRLIAGNYLLLCNARLSK